MPWANLKRIEHENARRDRNGNLQGAGMAVRPDKLPSHSVKLSANFADEFTLAQDLMASLRHGATAEDEIVETALTNYISLLQSWRHDSVTHRRKGQIQYGHSFENTLHAL